MQPRDPNSLDYRSPDGERIPDRPPAAKVRFFTGLAVGSAASLIYWPAIWHGGGGGGGPITLVLVVMFVLAKLIATVAFLGSDDRREVGVGLLVSFVIGFMIFVGTCGGNFKV